MILAIAGGVGGAKLAAGLADALAPGDLIIAVNTGDDFEHLGLHVSPDLDTVMYTLARLANPETGWGRAGETWSFMAALESLGGPAWFRLGDGDLATHVLRTRDLAAGQTLSTVTEALCRSLGITHRIVPATDDRVRTHVVTAEGALEFQHYFVRLRCAPEVRAVEYRGARDARPSPGVVEALASRALEAVIVCPSNPFLSVGPVLEIPEVRKGLASAPFVLAISPIVAGAALKGPAAKIMSELGVEPTVLNVARYYRGVIHALMIDRADAQLAPAIEALGIRAVVTDIIMSDPASRTRLADECVAFVRHGRHTA